MTTATMNSSGFPSFFSGLTATSDSSLLPLYSLASVIDDEEDHAGLHVAHATKKRKPNADIQMLESHQNDMKQLGKTREAIEECFSQHSEHVALMEKYAKEREKQEAFLHETNLLIDANMELISALDQREIDLNEKTTRLEQERAKFEEEKRALETLKDQMCRLFELKRKNLA